MASTANLRTRWAAIGAACAVTLGGGTLGIVQAAVSTGDRAVYVPISPVRVLDTRAVTPITNGTLKVVVEGAINLPSGSTQVVVPVDASAVALNITVTEGQKNGQYGFVTAFPCTSDTDTPPNASSLNFESNVDIANAMNVTTSANGSICFYVYGTADLIVDIAGYYANHNHDDRYYTETEVDTALADKASASDLTSGLAGKASASDLTSALAGKADVNSLFPPFVPSLPITVDSEGNPGQFNSIAIGTNGNPIISYLDGSNSALAVAACNDLNCSTSTKNIIDSEGQVGFYSSITIGANGNPVISYYDLSNSALKVAVCDNPTCTTSTTNTIDSANDVGWYTTIAIGVNGYPIIGYYDNTNKDLKVAACENPTCTMSTTNTIDSANEVGQGPSIAIGVNGNPIISYTSATNFDLKVVVCKNPTCSGATEIDRSINTIIDSDGSVIGLTSITIGTNGNPIISYYHYTNQNLKVAACKNSTCSGATESDRSTNNNLDSIGRFAGYDSIAIGANGNPIISYYDSVNGDLKVVSPWWITGGR